MQYSAKKFNLPTLSDISEKQVEVHLGLYEGYIKHINLLREQITDLETLNKEKYAYAVMELRRRLGFEFNGMRMHELYFSQWEGKGEKGASASEPQSGLLADALIKKYHSWEEFLEHFKTVGMSRGIGWTILYADQQEETVHTAWITDHELGQLGGLPIILVMDIWEHAYMVDYLPSEKKQYIEAFLKNLNWSVVEERFVLSCDTNARAKL